MRLMPALEDAREIPAEGKSEIIVAAVNCALHFRIFDRRGRVAVDTDETRLTEQTPQVEGLRKQLDRIDPLRELTRREKRRITSAVSSIVGQTIPRHWIFRVLGRMAIVVTAFFYVLVVFLAQYTSWGGASSLFEQHAFLLPAPFPNM